jgi:DNA-binding transcriptional ArsR family regulator
MSNVDGPDSTASRIPADVFTVTDLETLKVLADPYRMRIIETVGDDRLTVKQIAQRMGETVHKLYYHVRQLEQHGLMVEVDSRVVSGIVEKTYALSAKRFEVEKGLLGAGPEGEERFSSMVRSMMERAVDGAARAVRAGVVPLDGAMEERVVVDRGTTRMTRTAASEFIRRLEALVKEFSETPRVDAQQRNAPAREPADRDAGEQERRPFGLTIVFHELPDADTAELGKGERQ